MEKTIVQTMEMSRRISSNGMMYQILKRCGANADTLKNIKLYLYKNIEKNGRLNPDRK
jgi:hypothetical protein